MARRPLPPGQARTDKLMTKVRPEAGDLFRTTCHRLGLSPSDGLRKAAEDFVNKHNPKGTP